MTVALTVAPPARARAATATPGGASLARASLTLLPLQVVARAGEALLPVALAAWFGRSRATDLYNLASAFFTLVGALVFGLFRDSALVPILAELRAHRPHEIPRVLGSLLTHALTGAAALAALVAAGALAWFRASHHGGGAGGGMGFAALLALPLAARLPVVTARTFLDAVLSTEGRLRAPPAAGVAGLAVTAGVLAAAVHRHAGVAAIAPALLAGDVAALGALAIYAACAARLRLRPSFARPEPVRRFARRALSEVAGAAITRANPLVDQALAAATGVAGGGTLLRLAQDLGGVPTSLLQAGLLPVLLSRLARDAAGGRLARHRATVARAVAIAGAALAALAVAVAAARAPLAALVYGHGAMDAAGVARIARLLPLYLAGAVPFGALLMLARAHVSLGNSRIMFGMGVANAALNLGLDLALRRALGLEGIALATSLVSAAIAAVFALRLPRAYARARAAAAVTTAATATVTAPALAEVAA